MNFRDWYIRNQDRITWFLIGWLCWGGLDQFSRGHYGWAAIDFGLAYFNYKMSAVRL